MKAKDNRRVTTWIIAILLTLIGLLALYGIYFFESDDGGSINSGAGISPAEPSALDNPQSLLQEIEDLAIYNQGVLVQQIDLDGSAAQAGVRRGSIILEVNDRAVDSVDDLFQSIEPFEGGETISLTVLNGPTPETIAVVLADERPYLGINVGDGCDCGFSQFGEDGLFPEFDPEAIPEGFELPGIPEFQGNGVVVIGVSSDSPAAQAGMMEGDIITAVNGDQISSFDELAEQVRRREIGDELPLTVLRGSDSLALAPILAASPDDETQPYLGVRIGMFRSNSEN